MTVDMDARLMDPIYEREKWWEYERDHYHCENCLHCTIPTDENCEEFNTNDDRVGWCDAYEVFIRPWWTPKQADCEEFDFSNW